MSFGAQGDIDIVGIIIVDLKSTNSGQSAFFSQSSANKGILFSEEASQYNERGRERKNYSDTLF